MLQMNDTLLKFGEICLGGTLNFIKLYVRKLYERYGKCIEFGSSSPLAEKSLRTLLIIFQYTKCDFNAYVRVIQRSTKGLPKVGRVRQGGLHR